MFKKEEVIITNSFVETQKVGEKFVKKLNLNHARVIALSGDLGSGKTTFVQGMAKGLGIKKRLISPTFIILRTYKLNLKSQISKFFYHIDFYRIESENDLEGLGIEEILNDSQNIVAIEWAEKMGSWLPAKRWEVKFEDLGEEKRKIIITEQF